MLAVAALVRAFGPSEWAPAAALGTAALVVAVGYGAADDRTGAAGPGRARPAGGPRRHRHARPSTRVRSRCTRAVASSSSSSQRPRWSSWSSTASRWPCGWRGSPGAVLASLWAPTLVFETPPSTASLLVGATCWLLLLWLTRATPRPGTRPVARSPDGPRAHGQRGGGRRAHGPLASALPGYGTVRLPATWGPGIGGAGTAEPVRRPRPAFRPRRPARQRGPALHDRPRSGRPAAHGDPDVLRRAAVAPGTGRRRPARRRVCCGRTTPAPSRTGPCGVVAGRTRPAEPADHRRAARAAIAGSWRYDPARDEVDRADTRPGMTYQLTVLPRDLSATRCAPTTPRQLPSGAPELAVPDTPFAGRIAALARQVVGDATTAYDQAMALQSVLPAAGLPLRDQPAARRRPPTRCGTSSPHAPGTACSSRRR